jgi:hypothetical protein
MDWEAEVETIDGAREMSASELPNPVARTT